MALGLCQQFDHRGAPGHGAGLLLDIPWPLLLDRFPEHTRAIAQRDVALWACSSCPSTTPSAGCAWRRWRTWPPRRGRDVLGWADVPFNVEALPPGSSARRTAPVVRQALFRRPAGHRRGRLVRLPLPPAPGPRRDAQRDRGRRLRDLQPLEPHRRLSRPGPALADRRALPRPARRALRLALRALPQPLLDEHHHRLAARPAVLVPRPQRRDRDHPRQRGLDARHRPGPACARWWTAIPACAHRHARALGRLRGRLRQREPGRHADRAPGAAGCPCPRRSSPSCPRRRRCSKREPALSAFHEAMGVLLGACDGPAAIVACDGDEAVAHLDRNGLRPALDHDHPRLRPGRERAHGHGRPRARSRCSGSSGPGDTAVVRLGTRRGPADRGRASRRGPASGSPCPRAGSRAARAGAGSSRRGSWAGCRWPSA